MKGFNALLKSAILCVLLLVLVLSFSFLVCAQTWQALPPYNFLWPLWSPALSPVDPATGLKAPIISELYNSTVLPLQPGLVWNPIFDNPYFLYNSPVGLQYYDIIYGMNPWPPAYSLDLKGAPIPLNLPVGYQYLPPTNSVWIQDNLPIANQSYLAQYPTWALAAYNATLPPKLVGLDPWLASLIYPTPALDSLLTAANILGYIPVGATVAPAPVPVPPTAVAPTLVATPIVPPTAVATPIVPPTVATPVAPTVAVAPAPVVPSPALAFLLFGI